jgi:glucuronate isomerase
MKPFLDDNFLLETKTAEQLYHEHAKKMPIIDYHSHLDPEQIAENKQYKNITQPWLHDDHYKWRAMRANGADEKFCTGNASDWEKFQKWAATVPHTIRNPLFHWTHLELKRYFGITTLLSPKTAQGIYNETAEMLQSDAYRVRGLLDKMNVEIICTTDDPIDSLEYHKAIAGDKSCHVKVLPTWRPDKAMAVENTPAYNQYVDQLAKAADTEITSFATLIEALQQQQEHFASVGCKLSDHGLDVFYASDYTQPEINTIFKKVRSGTRLFPAEIKMFKSAMLYEFGIMNHKKGWVQQFHVGPIRNNNSRLFKKLGPDKGFDSMGDLNLANDMSKFLNRLDSENKLTKTILYNINPKDNEMMATMIGNFQDGTIPGKMQYGSGWWFLDQKDGMERQLNALSTQGLLSRFVGMLTDSRSFLSFPRHEYFRRILCNMLGSDVERGLIPNDMPFIGHMVENISYNNAKVYFGFE